MAKSNTSVRYAFYREGKDMTGEPVYGGRKSDGLERIYFGTDFNKAQQMVVSARKNGRPYRLDRLTYVQHREELECRTHTLHRFPLPTKKSGKTARRKALANMSLEERKAHRKQWKAK